MIKKNFSRNDSHYKTKNFWPLVGKVKNQYSAQNLEIPFKIVKISILAKAEIVYQIQF